ncbi:transcriptional regulator [Asanoa ishikariensis]|uniref:Transcriptional regulator, LysR family n=1 Tax=Asanoa ishikariensis TaxID=137265 RepID=A0A1H3TT21_9ACTN|nr:LysR family transcriptional regulator [Asanoa ishikariensis]GIF67435.1 transcriptional regulator [Asanoa ishikariensis]SDZ53340.1 transcriptional regulator, LysR family [Asanoa ishikariensis]
MDIRKLEVFTTVAEERSFTRAAERLHTAQSGVSTAIRALERDLGATLLDRTTQHVELTEAGRALLPEALRILSAVEAARETVTQVGQGLRGRLRLGILYGLTPSGVREALATFRTELPGVEIWLTAPGPRGTLDHLDRLRDGALDLAVVLTQGPLPGIEQQLLATDEVVLACPADHPLADRGSVDLADLADEAFVEFPPGWGVRSAVDRAYVAAGLTRRITVQMNDLATILDLVRLGLGLAFMPRSIIDQTDDLRFLEISDQPPSYRIVIATVAGRPLGPVARHFLRIAESTLTRSTAAASRGSAPPRLA